MKKVKLYSGSVGQIMQHYGSSYKVRLDYEQMLKLKFQYPRSLITNYKSRISEMALAMECSPRTVRRRVGRWLSIGLVYEEKGTLRLLSNTTIREEFSGMKRLKINGKRKRRWVYTEILVGDLKEAIRLQPLQDNSTTQKRVIAFKKKRSSSGVKATQKESDWTLVRNANPYRQQQIVEDVYISQKKAADLLGYRSQRSGHVQLQKLRASGIIEVRENKVKVNPEERHRFRKAGVIHKVKNGFYCFPNSIVVALPFERPEYQNKLDPRKCLPVMDRYDVTNPAFLDYY